MGQDSVPKWTSYRFAFAMWSCSGVVAIYLLRFSFSIGIVCMTYDPVDNSTGAENTSSLEFRYKWGDPLVDYVQQFLGSPNHREEECDGNVGGDDDETGEFDWDRQLRGTMSSSFFWGYVLTQVVGGLLAQRVGGKIVITVGTFIAAVSTLLSPVSARWSPYALIVCRFVNGVGQGVYFPAYYCMAGKWAPVEDRGLMDSIALAGAPIGSMLSFAVSGVLCAELGWPWVFYVYGIVCSVWLVCWVFLVFDSPAEHPKISPEEKKFIENSLNSTGGDERPKVPWRSFLTSIPMWVFVVNDFCVNWATYTGLTMLPQYMEDVLEFDIKSNGLFSALPQLLKFITTILFAAWGDYLVRDKEYDINIVRKIFQAISTLPPTCFVIAVGYLDCTQGLIAVVFLTLQEGFNGAKHAGASVARMDIAPRFAGMVMGFSNTSGNIAGIVAPVVISSITVDGTREQWQTCFFLSAVAYLIAFSSFTFLGTAYEQEWAKAPDDQVTMDVDLEKKQISTVEGYDNKALDEEKPTSNHSSTYL